MTTKKKQTFNQRLIASSMNAVMLDIDDMQRKQRENAQREREIRANAKVTVVGLATQILVYAALFLLIVYIAAV